MWLWLWLWADSTFASVEWALSQQGNLRVSEAPGGAHCLDRLQLLQDICCESDGLLHARQAPTA